MAVVHRLIANPVPTIFSKVVIAVSQIMFCRDLTECLGAKDGVLDAVKGAEQRCFQVFKDYAISNFYLFIFLELEQSGWISERSPSKLDTENYWSPHHT